MMKPMSPTLVNSLRVAPPARHDLASDTRQPYFRSRSTSCFCPLAALLSQPSYIDFFECSIHLLACAYDGLYIAAGRGIPDISAKAPRFPMVRKDDGLYMSDTSCSTSTVAGIPRGIRYRSRKRGSHMMHDV
ncbi:hypothetical protein EI94DRAFT_1306360 [Lactarius quietus]|nr:hypothetical protein EI94DRAFT_1306360 [Lactarius quietus]